MCCNSAHVHTLKQHGNHNVVHQSQPRACPNINHNIDEALTCDQMSEQLQTDTCTVYMLIGNCHLWVSSLGFVLSPLQIWAINLSTRMGDEKKMIYNWGWDYDGIKLGMRLRWYTNGDETTMVHSWRRDYDGIKLWMRLWWYKAGDESRLV